MNDRPIQLAILISGSGTTLRNIIERIADKSLNAEIRLVIASRADIRGIEIAREAHLRCEVIERKKFTSVTEFCKTIFQLCDEAKADLVCLAGWLSLLEIPVKWEGKVMNIHPALLPKFGGKGMYGQRVHQAVLDSHEKVSGCTVHFVDRKYDEGPIILQRTCPVFENDTPQTLAHRVFEEEKIAYPQSIQLFMEGRLRIEDRRVRVS